MKQPNVLIIHADQHRQDCLGAYGNSQIKTPNIDRLASDGILFENHFCAYPVCTPSRYSFLSGRYTHQHQGWNNHCTLSDKINTFPSILRDNGYQTTAVGKMHFTPTYLDVGFDKMLLCEQDGPGRFDDDYHRFLRDEGLIDDIDIIDQRQEYRKHAPQTYWDSFGAQESNLDEKHHSTTWITEQALKSIDQWEAAEPNLLMIGYVKPHHPFDPPAPYNTLYDPDSIDILPGYTKDVVPDDYLNSKGYFDSKALSPDKLRTIMAHYYGTITQIDDNVGRIISRLHEKNLYDDTLIIYTSDHGDYMGFHHMVLKGNYMYDPLVKIPLIVKCPHAGNSRLTDQRLTSNIDVAATILKTCSIPVPKQMSGYDLLDNTMQRDMVICEQIHADYEYMVRSGQYKLLISGGNKMKFFDLFNDPYEMQDLSKDAGYRDLILRHKEFLFQTVLFESQTQTHLDYQARVCKSAPTDVDSSRKTMQEYLKQKSSVSDYIV
ncbi:MAG: sulfatase family protein [Eubacteriales bacterium]